MRKDVIKNKFERIKDILMLPFSKHLVMLLFLFTTLLPYMWLHVVIIKYNGYVMGVHCFLLAYFATLIVSLIRPQSIRLVVQVILVVLSTIFFALNVYCLVEFQNLLDVDYLMLILNTNINEATEFLTSVLRLSIVLGVGGVLLFFLLLWILSRRHHIGINSKWSVPALVLLVILTLVNLMNFRVWSDGPVLQVPYLFYSIHKYQLPDNLELNNTNPSVTYFDKEKLPANVVLIIGESFSRSHSSLYGYDKQTNPRLGKLRDNSMLFAFDSIESPAVRTSESISFMMGLCTRNDLVKDSKKWHEYTTLIELMHVSGYDTYWYSNQDSLGTYNVVSRIFAQSCDYVDFIREGTHITNGKILDNELVDMSNQTVSHMDTSLHFVVYHLMGSHFDYKMRYPNEFEHFTEKDYPDCLENQRQVLAEYDNSILYNDYVVEQIINLFKDKDAVVIYVPDHAQDMFESDPDFFMHAKQNDPVSCFWGARIPFMVYVSPMYKEHYPEVVQRMQERQDHPMPWNSEDLPYFILDIMGVKTVNGVDVKTRSVL